MDQILGFTWFLIFVLSAGLVGIAMLLVGIRIVPAVVDRMTPNIDESKELARGNSAVADYYGRVVAGVIVAFGIVIAAAVVGGCILWQA